MIITLPSEGGGAMAKERWPVYATGPTSGQEEWSSQPGKRDLKERVPDK